MLSMLSRLRIQQLAIALLLTLGLTSTVLSLQRWREPNLPPAERQELLAAFLLLGMAPLAGAAWLGRSLQQTAQTAQDRRLRSIFFESLRLSQGRVNVLTFSMQSHLSGSAAKAYLSDRAREFNATFDVDDSGGLTYCFDLGDYPAALSGVEVTYSVLIMAIPDIRRRQVIRVLQKLTGLSWSDVKALAKETPALVKTKLSLPLAQEFRSRLEAVGATVSIVVD